jgi:type IV secretion system protein VirB5
MVFRRSVERYGRTPAPETPYQRAGQLWDERIGSARVQAHNWRRMAFGCLLLSAGMASGLVWQSGQSRIKPYVVEVDRLGEARAVAPAEHDYRPTDPQIAWQLSHFIQNVRGISLDPVLIRRAWLEAYDFTTDRGALALGDYARSREPFARLGERTISVQVVSVLRASDRSFQVKWIESEYVRGAPAGTARWTAILTLETRPPRSADALRRNPLGIYVDALSWSRDMDGGERGEMGRAPAVVPDRTALPAGLSDTAPDTAGAPDTPSMMETLP